MRILIAGGGTGGHVYPALAIADALRERIPASDILFVGSKGRMEMEKVPAAGYAIQGLNIRGLERRLTWRNLLLPFRLMGSLWQTRRILRRFRPDIAVGVGGYASGPVLRMAAWMGIPYILQEQNSHAGLTNRLLARRALRICVAWPGMEAFFPEDKLVFTGNPLRSSIRTSATDRVASHAHFGTDPTLKTVLLLGGSLGARTLNDSVIRAADWLREHAHVQLIWQCGKSAYEQCSASEVARSHQVRLLPFIERMDMAYTAADLIVARAGAMTIAELCQVGKPVILIPSPNVADDHQTANARSLTEQQAALLVADAEARQSLFTQVEALLADPERCTFLGDNIRRLARPEAAHQIADLLITLTDSRP
jgi:UDP-N-acetylglucosamine--N-acetylmuramyl-(pentapeptide) pyrophosphoryl-undecaprenol N-acetylglucosamine transferase